MLKQDKFRYISCIQAVTSQVKVYELIHQFGASNAPLLEFSYENNNNWLCATGVAASLFHGHSWKSWFKERLRLESLKNWLFHWLLYCLLTLFHFICCILYTKFSYLCCIRIISPIRFEAISALLMLVEPVESDSYVLVSDFVQVGY